jgi:hypothetical protein
MSGGLRSHVTLPGLSIYRQLNDKKYINPTKTENKKICLLGILIELNRGMAPHHHWHHHPGTYLKVKFFYELF